MSQSEYKSSTVNQCTSHQIALVAKESCFCRRLPKPCPASGHSFGWCRNHHIVLEHLKVQQISFCYTGATDDDSPISIASRQVCCCSFIATASTRTTASKAFWLFIKATMQSKLDCHRVGTCIAIVRSKNLLDLQMLQHYVVISESLGKTDSSLHGYTNGGRCRIFLITRLSWCEVYT